DSRNFKAGLNFFINKNLNHVNVEFQVNHGTATYGPQAISGANAAYLPLALDPLTTGGPRRPLSAAISLAQPALKSLLVHWHYIFWSGSTESWRGVATDLAAPRYSGSLVSLQPQVRRPNLRVRPQLLRAPAQLHLPRLDHVPARRDLERRREVLLDQQDRHPALVQRPDRLEHLFDHDRREPQRRLVEQQQRRPPHPPPPPPPPPLP